MAKATIALLLAATLLCASCVPASSLRHGVPEEGAWRATGEHVEVAGLVGAPTRGNVFQAFLLQPGLERSGVVGAAVNWEASGYFIPTGEQISGLELEASLSQHFGLQAHAEGTLAVVARWHAFLVDDAIQATASIGQGISWATSVPVLEDRRWPIARQLMSYNSYELTLASPGRPGTMLVFRLHHRSGMFGVFGGAREGSNVALMGLRYRFDLD